VRSPTTIYPTTSIPYRHRMISAGMSARTTPTLPGSRYFHSHLGTCWIPHAISANPFARGVADSARSVLGPSHSTGVTVYFAEPTKPCYSPANQPTGVPLVIRHRSGLTIAPAWPNLGPKPASTAVQLGPSSYWRQSRLQTIGLPCSSEI